MSDIKSIIIPDIGGAENVDVIEIHVKEGDQISQDDTLITLEGDKATMDVPSSDAGVVKSIQIKVGDKVSEGYEILQLAVMASDSTASVEENQPEEPQAKEETPESSASPAASQTIEVVIPDIGGAEGVDVIEVHVTAGDTLEAEQTIITLEGDKATMDVPTPQAGIVESVTVQVGDKVSEGDKVLLLSVSEGGTTSSEPKAEAPKVEEAPAKPEPAPAVQPQTASKSQEPTAISQSFSGVHAGPAVRKMARVLGADLTRVKATGPKGRILKEDLESYIHNTMTDKLSPAAHSGQGLPQMPKVDFSKFGEIEVKPLSKIKKLTGANMQRNWQLVPHVTQFDEADITDLEDFRQEQKQSANDKGIKLTMLAFLVKAVVGVLKKYPEFNASLDETGENLVLKKYFHIGVAVDTPDGLVVPVIKNADQLGLFECAEVLMQISQKARNKQLTPSDMQGSCFTISSLGGVGGTAFTPIVNAPDVAILGVSRSSVKPVFNGEDFEARLMLPLSLSYDHRVIDGVSAARFTTYLAELLADIRTLLL